VNHSASPTEPGRPEQFSAGDGAPFGALVLGRQPILRAGVTAVIREEFGAQVRVLCAGWAERQRALATAANARLRLVVVLPDRGEPLVDWPGLALAAPGAAVVVAVAAAELAARQAAAPAAVRVIALGAALATWRENLRAAVAAARDLRARARPARRAAPAPLRALRMPLTQRQHEVYGMLSLGYSNKDIADRLGLAVGTVKLHVGAVLQALQARNRVDLLLRHAGAAAAGERFGIHGAVLRRPIPLTSEDL
jgi:DNA-binding NarL/FixJ family response regulator